MTTKINFPYTEHLVDTGLSIDQAEVYQLLIQLGGRSASVVARLTSRSRPHAYKLLHELAQYGLVKVKKKSGDITKFYPEHPFALTELMRRKQEKLRLETEKVNTIISLLISDFNKSSQVPGIRILDGLSGLETVYADIISSAQQVDLIRSQVDHTIDGYRDLISDHIQKKIKNEINTRIIGPLSTDLTIDDLKQKDAQRRITRRVSPAPLINTKSEIVLFSNKVAITTYEQPYITTIIENQPIVDTLKAMFESIWLTATPAY